MGEENMGPPGISSAASGAAHWERRMLSGEPFTYGSLCEERAKSEQGAYRVKLADHDRLIDRAIQKLRRKGLISFTREAGKVVWRPTAADTSDGKEIPGGTQ